MKLKHLESALSSVTKEFPSPNILLEQYPTSASLTASVVFTALQNGDLGPGLTALDLGCGTGMLMAGCALVECDHVFGVDCDEEALAVATQNVIDLDVEDRVSFLLAKVAYGGAKQTLDAAPGKGSGRHRNSSRGGRGRGGRRSNRNTPQRQSAEGNSNTSLILNHEDGMPLRDNCVDTVLTNPPFGTKHNAGMDVQFLRTATRLARRSVYSFHKSSTRDYLIKKVSEWGMEVTVVAQMKFDLANTYKFHQRKSVDVEVDLLRVSVQRQHDDDDDKEEPTSTKEHAVEDGDDSREEYEEDIL